MLKLAWSSECLGIQCYWVLTSRALHSNALGNMPEYRITRLHRVCVSIFKCHTLATIVDNRVALEIGHSSSSGYPTDLAIRCPSMTTKKEYIHRILFIEYPAFWKVSPLNANPTLSGFSVSQLLHSQFVSHKPQNSVGILLEGFLWLLKLADFANSIIQRCNRWCCNCIQLNCIGSMGSPSLPELLTEFSSF